jgi:hypothetical protein
MFWISHYSVARWRCGQGSQVAKAPEYKLMAHNCKRRPYSCGSRFNQLATMMLKIRLDTSERTSSPPAKRAEPMLH